MDPLVPYTLPIKGLHNGIHTFHFQIERDFFEQFEGSPINDAVFELALELDKRPDMLILAFEFHGKVFTECDRCLADIQLPVDGHNRLVVKYGEEEGEPEADVLYIEPETTQLNIAQYVYEYLCLALPIIKVYDCEEEETRVCDDEMLKYLNQDASAEDDNNPLKEALKNLNKTTGN